MPLVYLYKQIKKCIVVEWPYLIGPRCPHPPSPELDANYVKNQDKNIYWTTRSQPQSIASMDNLQASLQDAFEGQIVSNFFIQKYRANANHSAGLSRPAPCWDPLHRAFDHIGCMFLKSPCQL